MTVISKLSGVAIDGIARVNAVNKAGVSGIDGVLVPPVFTFAINTAFGDAAFRLPLSGTVNFVVDWGDGDVDAVTSDTDPAMAHTYASGGTYDISLSGVIGTWNSGTTTDRNKVTDVKRWADNFTSGNFQNFTNLTGDTAPDYPLVNNFGNFYSGCSNFDGDISDWDVSNVFSMSAMFSGASSFNQDISSWVVSNVLTMSGMFNDASSFNQDIGSWPISSLRFCSFMLTNSGLSTSNYDALLIGWAAQAPSIQTGVTLSTGPQRTSASLSAYNLLTSATYGWNISDGGLI